jgi:CPA1 family monovalent cation:H+ antiporter
MTTVVAVLGLVLLAIVVAAVAHRLSTPAPSLLVVVGLGVGFIPGVHVAHLSPDVVVLGLLPPLLFAAARETSLPDLRDVWRTVTVLAVGLVLVTAACVAFVARWVDGRIGIAVAFMLGAVLASTDPVAVTALSRRLRLPARVATLVQAESLFNDATSLVLFQVAVVAATTSRFSGTDAAGRFAVLAGGGVLVGAVVGFAGEYVVRIAREPTVQAALALATPYVAAVGAQEARVSPVTAVIVAGLLLAGRQPRRIALIRNMYAVVVFLLENVVFAIIGLQLASFLRELHSSERVTAVELVAAVTVTLLVTRALALAAVVAGARRSSSRRPRWAAAAVVTWAGARGVVPLAAVLAIPGRTPHRALLVAVATAVVVVTLVVQGTTLAPLVRRVGLAGRPGDDPGVTSR